MTDSWTLRASVFGVAVKDDVVFLDLAQDEYTCLPGAAPAIQVRPDGGIDGLDPGTARMLAEADLIQRGGLSRIGAALPRAATSDLAALSDPRPSIRYVPAVLGMLSDLRNVGHDPAVSALLTLAAEPGGISDAASVTAAALAFRTLLPWLPIDGQCLKRSALLAAFLRRQGLSGCWVFGVRTWPFRAHCWIQHGDVCLNDDADRLRAYTPIFSR